MNMALKNLLLSLIACATLLVTNVAAQNIKGTLALRYGFKLEACKGETSSYQTVDGAIHRFTTFASLRVLHGNRVVFCDSSDSASYELRDGAYPILLKFPDSLFEIAVLLSSPPAADQARLLSIRNDKLVRSKIIPKFFGPPKDLAGNGTREYAGILDLAEEWGRGPNDTTVVTAYNPILYYKLTRNGLVLDSALTRLKNRVIYGRFYGYYLSYKHAVPVSECDPKLDREIDRIKR